MSELKTLKEKIQINDNEFDDEDYIFVLDVKETMKKIKEELIKQLDNKSDSFKSSITNEWEMCVDIDSINETIDETFNKHLGEGFL